MDDIVLPGMLEATFVRSPLARARIVSISLEAALRAPGVRAIFVAQDLKQLPLAMFYNFGSPASPMPVQTPLAEGYVRFAGDPVALIIAENRYLAEDAAELVEVEYDAETPVLTIADAISGSDVHPDLPGNICDDALGGDDPEIDAIFAGAAHVVSDVIRHQRQTHVPMETRGLVAACDGAGELTVYYACQNPHQAARYISKVFDLPDHHVRVVAKDVGGAFGLKVQPMRDELAVVAATLITGHTIKWIEDRVENLTAGYHAREQEMSVKLAFDAGGHLLAADIDHVMNLGAYPQGSSPGPLAMMMFSGPYRLPKLRHRTRSYFSNTCGLGAYRGPWMIESLGRETMMDLAARQMGIDPVDLRRRNLIRKEEQPFVTPTGLTMERISPVETLEKVVREIDLGAFRQEQAAAREAGRYLGLGFAAYVEPTVLAFAGTMATESVQVRVEPTGKVVATSSTHSQGHSTQTTIAQVVADELGVDLADVTVLEGDSSRGGFGAAAGGSRQAVAGGGAAKTAAGLVRDKVKKIAAHMLNASPDLVEIKGGQILVDGVAEVSTTLTNIAEAAYFNTDRLPPDMEPGLEFQFRYRPPPMVFSNAAHACVVEVDIATGMVKILRWVVSEDCGVMINPAVVEGQVSGGVVQGIGGVLFEHAAYDDCGNPTAVTFKDYLLPQIGDVPVLEFVHTITPSDTPGGFKGVGEGGAIIGPPTLVNAIADALSPLGVRCLDLPLTPDRILGGLQQRSAIPESVER